MYSENASLRISPAGLALVKEFEGWYPKAYRDPVGVWTIGYGTIGPEARPGRTITKKQGEEYLRLELEEDENTVKRLVKVPLNQHQFDALVSFVYNVGSGNFSKSTLLKLVNSGNFTAASGQFARWNTARDRATGVRVTLRGLTRRRNAEASLFMRDVEDSLPSEQLDMEKQAPLENPNSHDANVIPDSPSSAGGALGTLITGSDTFKAATTALAGLLTAATQLIEPMRGNPVLFGAVFVMGAALGSIIMIKLRDLKEGR